MAAQTPAAAAQWRHIESAANVLKVAPQRYEIVEPDDVEHAFASLIRGRAQGLIVLPHAVTNVRRTRIVKLAAEHRLPGMYPDSQYVEAGGLMSYAANFADLHKRAAILVDKILKGARPAELPIQQPTTFDLVISLRTAKALGLTIPPSLLLRADQVIE
jgi:putative ABC transport system substrate-binding protein